jgi:peptidoglycan/LPS O-acetylase OafA/YrhL
MRSLGSSSYSLYLTHAPIVVIVYDGIVAGRIHQGVPAFVVTLAIALPVTIVFARVFASVFEAPFRQRGSSAAIRPQLPQAQGAAG